MQDQLSAAEALGIKARELSSFTSREATTATLRAVATGTEVQLLYVTPERVVKSKRLLSALEKAHKAGFLTRFVIDEAHCCSEWGHDFRPDYKKLRVLKTQFADVPILALTATATPHIQREIKKILCIEGCEVFRSPSHRPNLVYSVVPKPLGADEVLDDIAKFILKKHPSDSGPFPPHKYADEGEER